MFRDDVFHAATTICFELRLQAKDRVIDPFPGTISGFMDQSAFYQRLALFGSVENAVKYFEFKVCTEKRATKAFTILNMLLTSIKSQMLAAEGFSRLDGTSDGTVLTIDDACPLASRRCRELLLGDGTSNASGANREGHHEPLQSAGPDLGTTVRPDSSHHTNESRNSMQPTIMEEDVTGGNLRDLDLDWYFSLDPLSPYPINTWSELDPLTI
ncbi:hypothetical protein EYZ11_004627 [Aspergillus tanneri]|uniref:Transcription factor domain-containing protein n=1 Tax=Aspergillus tanneri TaxID=1220188 RepID=A0A4S3JK33_9EURO|nr:hypothetical protein EYZ11_004627 [Aspergillus tanneri]